MKKALALLLGTVFSMAQASPVSDDPRKMYDVTKGTNRSVQVEWRTVDNPLQVCNRESKNFGNGGFAYAVQACAFWWDNRCIIITGKKTDHDTIGHEIRHCFQGDWHEQKTK